MRTKNVKHCMHSFLGDQVTTGEEEDLVGQILSEVDEKSDWWIGGNNHADQVVPFQG